MFFISASTKDKKKYYFTHDWKDPINNNRFPNGIKEHSIVSITMEKKFCFSPCLFIGVVLVFYEFHFTFIPMRKMSMVVCL